MCPIGNGWPVAVSQFLAVLAATLLLILAAAKAHGRQIRLERERAGVWSVDFRKDNGPVVEAIWRDDRIRFWTMFAFYVALSLLAVYVFPPPAALPRLAVLLLWSFAGSFIGAGLLSLYQLVAKPGGEAKWREQALRGSIAWWFAVSLAAMMVAGADAWWQANGG